MPTYLTFLVRSLALTFIATGGCVFLPETTARYDPACQLIERHMTLKAYQVGVFARCQNEGCIELLALAGLISAASFVVSGSVAVVGDTVYWLEAKGQCLKKE